MTAATSVGIHLSPILRIFVLFLLGYAQTVIADQACPPPIGDGPGMFAGTPKNLISSLPAIVAKLESVGRPLRLSPTPKSAQLGGVYYEGTVTGRYLIPTDGKVSALSIDGKPFKILSGNLRSACVRTAELGVILILFSPTVRPGQATIVLTAEQLDKLQ